MRVLDIRRNGQIERIATFLTEDEIALLAGVPPQAVIGIVDSDDSMQVNSLFREFLHEAIARHAPLDPDMQQAASVHGDGRLVYIDSRVPGSLHPVPSEDILGWFLVRRGRIVEGSYLPNPEHRIVGNYGLTAALGGLRPALVDSLLAGKSA